MAPTEIGRCATDITGRLYGLRALPIGARKAASARPLVILEARAREAERGASDRVRHQLSRHRSGRLGREHRYVHPLALERLDFHLAEFHYASVVRDAFLVFEP